MVLIGKCRRVFGLTFAFQIEYDHSTQKLVAKSLKMCRIATGAATPVI